MSLGFPLLALAMLILGSLFVIWPLWRVGEAGAQSGVDASGGSAVGTQPAPTGRLAAMSLSVLLSGASLLTYATVGQPKVWLEPEVLKTVALADASGVSGLAEVPSTEEGAESAGGGAAGNQERANGANAPAGASGTDGIGADQIAAMVARLAQRLQAQPDDPDGWR